MKPISCTCAMDPTDQEILFTILISKNFIPDPAIQKIQNFWNARIPGVHLPFVKFPTSFNPGLVLDQFLKILCLVSRRNLPIFLRILPENTSWIWSCRGNPCIDNIPRMILFHLRAIIREKGQVDPTVPFPFPSIPNPNACCNWIKEKWKKSH